MADKIKFSQLEALSSNEVKRTAIFPIVQDGENYQIALSGIPVDSTLAAASGSWESTYTTVSANSASWDADLNVVNEFQASSGSWESTYTTVSANSASWATGTVYDDTPVTELQAASGSWESTYTTVSANSASWDNGGPSGTTLSGTTANDTQTEIFVDGVASSRMTIATNTTWMFSAMVAARSATESAGYKIEGVIKNDGGTTSLVGTAVKTVFAEEDSAWDITVEADDTNDALVFKVTGDSADSVVWEVTVNKTEAS